MQRCNYSFIHSALKKIGWVFSLALITSQLCYASNGLIDPTKPYSYEKKIGPENKAKVFKLNMIVHSSNRQFAVINGKVFHAGDNISGYKVVKVSKNSVELDRQGTQYHLPLLHAITQDGSINKIGQR